MLRYRRYRAFVVFVIFALAGAYYYFASSSAWSPPALATSPWSPHKNDVKQDAVQGHVPPPDPQLAHRPDLGGERNAELAGGKQGQKEKQDQEELLQKPQLDDGKAIVKPKEKPEEDAASKPKPVHKEDFTDGKAADSIVSSKAAKPKPTDAEDSDDVDKLPPPAKTLDGAAGQVKTRTSTSTTSTSSIVHWTKHKEYYPLTSTIQLPTASPKSIPRIQHIFGKESDSSKEARLKKLAAIRKVTKKVWDGYKSQAWLHDETRPVMGEFKDPFCGWAATLVDSLDTLYVMGLEKEFEEGVEAVKELDFTTSTRGDIPLFETTIRYLGGLLGAYDISGAKHKILLTKAVELAEVLIGAFDTPNRMPVTFYHWQPWMDQYPLRASVMTVFAELGSLSVEFTRLAQLTEEPKYYDAIDRITDALVEWQTRPANGTRLPGLFPTQVDASGCEPQVIVPVPMDTEEPITGLSSSAMSAADDDNDVGGSMSGSQQPAHQVEDVEDVQAKHVGTGGGKKGKILGWKDPIAEGTLDSKINKDKLLSGKSQEISGSGSASVKTPQGTGSEPKGTTSGAEGLDDHPKEKAGSGSKSKQGFSGKTKRAAIDKMQSDAEKELDEEISAPKSRKGGQAQGISNSASTSGSEAKLATIPASDPNRSRNRSPFPESPSANRANRVPNDNCDPKGLTSSNKYGTDDFTLSGMADSVYEYFPKQWLLLGGVEKKYQDLYERSIDVATEKLLFRPQLPNNDDILIAGDWHAREIEGSITGELSPATGHLACFAGGMYAMAAKIYDRPNDLDTAARLTDGCVWAYASTKTGIMPEAMTFLPCESKKHCEFNKTAYWDAIDPYWEDREIMHKAMVKEQKEKAAQHAASVPGSATKAGSSVDGAASDQAPKKAEAAASGNDVIDLSEAKKKSTEHSLGKSDAKNPQLISDDASELNQKNPQKIADDAAGTVDQKNPQKITDDEDELDVPKSAEKVSDVEAVSASKTKNKQRITDDTKAAKHQRRQIDELDEASSPRRTSSASSEASEVQDTADEDDDSSQLEHGLGDIKAGKPLDYANAPSTGSSETSAEAGSPLNYNGDAAPSTPSPSTFDETAPILPPTHEEYVLQRIANERLPPGVVSIPQAKYILRPEAIESVWYMYRITGEQRWRDAGWKMWLAVSKYTAAEYGNSAIDDVTSSKPELLDGQESFWIAETLKYFYLLFSDEDVVSLDEWVLNTEAHPFRRPKGPIGA